MVNSLFVSVVVCAYNEEKYLASCLEALRIQSYPSDKYEIIIIDDDSYDETLNIANNFLLSFSLTKLPFVSVHNVQHGGLSVARNTGIHLSKGDIVAFIDGDAIAANNWIENMVNEFAKTVKPQIIGGPIRLLNKESRTAFLLYNSIFSFEMATEHAIIGTNMAFSKELLTESIVFNPLFVSRGDESYVFTKFKIKHNISPRKVDSIIVDHESPESIKSWLKTRYENGYYSVVISNLFRNEKSLFSYSKLFISLISFIVPLLFLLSLIFQRNLLISFIFIILYFLLLIKRFIISKFIQNVVKVYYANTKENINIFTIIYLVYIVIAGTFVLEYGYLKGFLKHRNYFFKKAYSLIFNYMNSK